MENNTNNNNKSILDILLDENNEDPIVLYDETGKQVKWDQIAVIPMGERLYAILKPLDEIPGIAEDEAIVFRVDELADDYVCGEMGDDCALAVETDPEVADAVFEKYYAMLEEIASQEEQDILPRSAFEPEDGSVYGDEEEKEDSFDIEERKKAFYARGYKWTDSFYLDEVLFFVLHQESSTSAVVEMGPCHGRHIVIPETYGGKKVTEIAPDAFAKEPIVSITIPETVCRIGSFAFDHCTELKEIRIKSKSLFIEASAFFGCTALKRVVFEGDADTWRTFQFENWHAYPLSYGATLAFAPKSDE